MYRVDGDSHISNLKTGKRIDAEQLIERLDTAGIDRSLIWLHPAQSKDEYCDYVDQNRYIYDVSKKYPDRFLPMGWINPRQYSFDECKDQLKRYTEEYGFLGIKLNGHGNFYDITDKDIALPIIEEIAKTGKVLAFHCGSEPDTHPTKVAKIASMFPETRILLVHFGREANAEALEAAKANKNINLVGSEMQDYSYVVKAVNEIGSDRVCFGSDSPFSLVSDAVAIYKPLLEQMSEKDAEMVMGGSLLKFFGKL